MKNKNTQADYVIGNYHMYVTEIYSALERLQDYLEASDVKAVLESEDPVIQARVQDECVQTDFVGFCEDIKHAMGY
jgi:hypothetical protein